MRKITTFRLAALLAVCCALAIGFTGCKKDDNNNNTTPAFTYQVNNIGEVTVPRGGSALVPWEVKLLTGSQQNVTLTVTGLPSGITASLSPASGIATFTSSVTFSAASSVSQGSYPYTVTASTNGQSNKTYTSNVIVSAPADCTAGLLGSYNVSEVCNPGSGDYASAVSASGTVNRINFANFGNYGSSEPIYADLNCSNNTLNIPTQTVTVGGIGLTISGSGTFSTNQIIFTYTATYSGASDNCTATYTK